MPLDLFDKPDPIKFLPQCVAAKWGSPEKKKKTSLRRIANELGIGYMTVKRALRYHRLMLKEGLTAPYRELTKKPASAPRWKRRK